MILCFVEKLDVQVMLTAGSFDHIFSLIPAAKDESLSTIVRNTNTSLNHMSPSFSRRALKPQCILPLYLILRIQRDGVGRAVPRFNALQPFGRLPQVREQFKSAVANQVHRRFGGTDPLYKTNEEKRDQDHTRRYPMSSGYFYHPLSEELGQAADSVFHVLHTKPF